MNKARDNSGYNTHIPPLIMPGRVKRRVQEVQKEENGVKYVDIRCNLCDFTGWVKMSDLIAPAK